MTSKPEERIVDLETKLTFLESVGESLSEMLLALERRVEQIESGLKRLEARGPAGGEGEEPDPLNERPPHY